MDGASLLGGDVENRYPADFAASKIALAESNAVLAALADPWASFARAYAEFAALRRAASFGAAFDAAIAASASALRDLKFASADLNAAWAAFAASASGRRPGFLAGLGVRVAAPDDTGAGERVESPDDTGAGERVAAADATDEGAEEATDDDTGAGVSAAIAGEATPADMSMEVETIRNALRMS